MNAMSQSIFVCPECKSVQYLDIVETCPICGSRLSRKLASDEGYNDQKVSVEIDFTILGCDVCGAKNSYRSDTCHSCKTLLTDDDGKPFVPESIDPIVQRRRKALTSLFEMREKMLKNTTHVKSVEGDLDEGEYRLEFVRMSESLTQKTDKLRHCLSSIDFRGQAIESANFEAQVMDLQDQYTALYNLVIKVFSMSSPATWSSLHKTFQQSVRGIFQGYLRFLDTLYIEDFQEAGELTSEITSQWNIAGQILTEMTSIVVAGKRLRYGDAESLSEALIDSSDIEISILDWAERGWLYFDDIFSRDREALQEEHGFALAIFAILAETFDSPSLFRNRVERIADLLRRADATRRDSLKSVIGDLQSDFSHARALLFDIGQQIIAIDFTKLGPRQEFRLALDTYHTLSEGVFKNLLTVLLYSERLIEGESPNYDEISRRSFGIRVKRHKPGKPKSLADSSDPVIAELADDLVMYIRHSDAHCDFRFEQDRIVVFERHHSSHEILQTHKYGQEEFFALVNKLFEAITAMFLGVLCLQIELHENYSFVDESSLLREEKLEFCKILFATNGLIINTIEQETSTPNEDEILRIHADMKNVAKFSPNDIGPPLYALTEFCPEIDQLEMDFYEDDALQGTVSIPAWHFHKYGGTSRAKQLKLLDLYYRMQVEYTDPWQLLAEHQTPDEVFGEFFLKGLSVYLNDILEDCNLFLQNDAAEGKEQLKRVLRELQIIDQSLATITPPTIYSVHHAWALESARGLKGLVRSFKKLKGNGRKKQKQFRKLEIERSKIHRLIRAITITNNESEAGTGLPR